MSEAIAEAVITRPERFPQEIWRQAVAESFYRVPETCHEIDLRLQDCMAEIQSDYGITADNTAGLDMALRRFFSMVKQIGAERLRKEHVIAIAERMMK